MLARVPWVKPLKTKAKPRTLTKARKAELVTFAADILRNGEPTRFALEGYTRTGLRSAFCLRGWTWTEADDAAALVVSGALSRLGARRPTWRQGQPEWTQEGVIQPMRSRCIRCEGLLPEGRRKFCSHLCHAAFHMDIARKEDRAASNAKIYAYRAAWSAKQPDRQCERCGASFKPKHKTARFCSVLCRNRHNAEKNPHFGTLRRMPGAR